jgi:hypothetical protein
MVVIVNTHAAVDKTEFVYSVNGLRAHEAAGQALYRCWTDVGQKRGQQKNQSFCTSDPVDMQDFFHSGSDFLLADRRLQDANAVPDATSMLRFPVDQAEVEQYVRQHPDIAVAGFFFFLQTTVRSRSGDFSFFS